MLELSNFLLPSCWASVPLGGFVPDNRIESEVVLATKCMLEKEKRFYRKTSKSRAQVFTLCEHLQDPQLEKFLFSIHCSCQGDHSQSNASCPRGRHIPRNPLTVSTFVRQDAFGDINFFFFPSGLSRESYSFFFFFRQNDVGLYIPMTQTNFPLHSKRWSPLIPLGANLLLSHGNASCFPGLLWQDPWIMPCLPASCCLLLLRPVFHTPLVCRNFGLVDVSSYFGVMI